MPTTETSAGPVTLERAVVPKLGELFPSPGHWTERDYLALPETTRSVELADGSLEIHETPSEVHQRVLGNLHVLSSNSRPGGTVSRLGLVLTDGCCAAMVMLSSPPEPRAAPP